jgi:methylated-DNA-protein-cysteine methyltransferase-like protein
MSDTADVQERLYALIRRIPPGRVSTYGTLARALGGGVDPREVGRLISGGAPGHDVPTHRVVSARGVPLCPRGRGSEQEQRAKLEGEGVALDARGRVPLQELLWVPEPE